MKVEQRKVGVVLSYISQGIHILSGLVFTPIMLRLLGQSEYGLYQLVYSIVSYLGLLSLGFTSSYMRFYVRYKANSDDEEIARLNGMFMTIFLVIAGICIACGAVMIINSESIFGAGLTIVEHKKSKILLAMMVFNMAVTFPSSVFGCQITAHERFVFQKLLDVFQQLFNPFICLPLLLLGFGSVGMVAVATILTVVKLIANAWFCLHKLKVRFLFKGMKPSLLKEMWAFTFFIFINQIIDQINWNLDKFLLGRIVGTTGVAIYGVGNTIRTLYNQFATTVSSVFVIQVNRIVTEKPDEKGDTLLTELFTKVGRIQFVILSLMLSGFIFFGKQFIRLWVGDGYEDSYWVAIPIMIAGSIPLVQTIGIEVQRAKNKHQIRSIVYACIAIFNVAITIPLIKKFGAPGASIGTAIAVVLGNGVFMNIYYHTKIGIDMKYFWKRILSFIPTLIPIIITGVLFDKFIVVESWLMLVTFTMLYSVVFCISMWLLGLNEYEKKLVLSILKKLKRA